MSRVNRLNILLIVMISLILLVLPVLGACAPTKEVPKEKVKLPILVLIGLTGAYSVSMIPISEGEKAAVNWANDTNFVPGGEIELRIYDCGDDPAKAVSAYKRGMGETPKPVIVCSPGTTLAMAINEFVVRDKIPNIDGTTNPLLQGGGWVFSYQSRYDGMTAAQLDYFLKEIWTGGRLPRVAFMAWDNAAGKAFMTDQAKKYIKAKNVEYMGEVWIPPNPSDTTAQALQLKQWNPDFIISGCIYPADQQVIIKDLDRVGLTGKYVLGNPSSNDVGELVRFVGAGLTKGFFGMHPYMTREEFPSWAEKHFTKCGISQDAWVMFGCGLGMGGAMFAETLKRAANTVGVDKITGQDCYNAIRTIKNYKFCFGNAVDFTEDLVGINTLRVFKVQNDGKYTYTGKDVYIPNFWPGGKDVIK